MNIIKEVKGFKEDVNKYLNDKNKLLGHAWANTIGFVCS